MLLESLSQLVNRNIAGSSRARELCELLEGRTFAVRVEGLVPIQIHARVDAGQLQLSRETSEPADASVAGTPLMLLGLAGKDAAQRMRSGEVAIEGDAEIAQAFHELLRAARPDIEEELSRLVGDVAAHQLGNFARTAFGWGERSASTFAQNVSEYLREESRDLVTRTEADEFIAGVDTVRDALDRIEARIDRLSRARRDA